MKQWVLAVVMCASAAVLAGVVFWVADDEQTLVAAVAQRGEGESRVAGEGGPGGEHPGRGHGPHPWAHSTDKADKAEKGSPLAEKGKPSKEWKARWRALSESERADLMADLAQEHAAGMRAFGRCKAAGETECTKPLPPGLAKKAQLGR